MTAATPAKPAPARNGQAAAQQQQRPPAQQDLSALVDQMVAEMRPHQRASVMSGALEQLAPQIERLLPPRMKGQGQWLAARAANYFDADPKLSQCPPNQFIRAVLRAAEMGLALDGKLCYCVKYKDAYQCVPDYKGLIAVAKSAGMIRDCKAEVVKENDKFTYVTGSAGDVLTHEIELRKPRGNVIGAYARFILPDGSTRIDYMTLDELVKIRAASPAKKDGQVVGPWAQWPDEMFKKSPVRRGMKFFVADPTALSAIEAAEVGEELDALVSLENAGIDPAVFTDEMPPRPGRDVLERDLRAILTEAKAGGLLDAAGYTRLQAECGITQGKRETDAQIEMMGLKVQDLLDMGHGGGGGVMFPDDAPGESEVPAAMRA